jgi:hypothetical protein
MFLVPTVTAIAVASFFWGAGRDSTPGSVAGVFVILAAFLAAFTREYADVIEKKLECLRTGTMCVFEPSEFQRYAVYAAVAFLDIAIVFLLGLRVESRRRS